MKIFKKFGYKDIRFFVSVFAAWTILLLFLPLTFRDDNLIYAIGEKHAFDSSLFNNNIYMGIEGTSPRYITDFLFKIIMTINHGSWADAALLWIYFGIAILSIAIANLAKNISQDHQVYLSVIFTCIIRYVGNYKAGNFSLIAHDSTSMGPAIAFAILAISFVIGQNKQYKYAWIFSAIATLCHIHEGIYCCTIIGIIALVDCILKRKLLLKENLVIIIPIIIIAIVVVPSLVTDSNNISSAEFVRIYSVFRHPHHLVPSSWGLDSIYKTFWTNICFMLLSIETIYLFEKEKLKKYLWEVSLFNGVWIIALLLMYFFTEKWPVAFISTMYLSKLFKYIYLVTVVWQLKAIINLRKNKCIISGYLLLFFLIISPNINLEQMVMYFFITTVIIIIEVFSITKNQYFFQKYTLPTDILFFGVVMCSKKSLGFYNSLIICFIFFAIICIEYIMTNVHFGGRGILIALICICMITSSLYDKVIFINDGSISKINGEKVLKYSLGEELYDLAENFKYNTNYDIEFLADPDVNPQMGWFQIVSERNCYVLQKVIPSSKSTVAEWYRRYMQVRGFAEKSGEELKSIMENEGISYLLVNNKMYGTIDQTPGFSIFDSSTNDSYRIYKLT